MKTIHPASCSPSLAIATAAAMLMVCWRVVVIPPSPAGATPGCASRKNSAIHHRHAAEKLLRGCFDLEAEEAEGWAKLFEERIELASR